MFYRIKQLTLLIGDWLALYAALFAALWLRFLELPISQWNILFAPMTRLFVVAAVIFFIVGLYDIGQSKNRWPFFQKIFVAMAIWLVAGMIYFYLSAQTEAKPKTIMLLCAAIGTIFISAWRALHNKFLSKSILKTNIVFVGLPKEALELIKKLENEPEIGYEIVGVIKGGEEVLQASLPGFEKYPVAESLGALSKKQNKPINLIIVAPSMAQNLDIAKELYQQLFRQVSVVNFVQFYEEIMKRIPPSTFSESWFLANLQEQDKKVYDRFKTIIDFLFAVIMGAVFAVTFPIIALVIKLTSSGPIFFIQDRVGRNSLAFKIYKYRTMLALSKDGSAEINGAQFASENDQRITFIGRFLRKTRLDELPQFINIFKNEMSLIGPRPERLEFVLQLTAQMPYYALRHLIKPGLTGWGQIQKSYYGTIEENLRKLEYDLYYLKNRGLLLDAAIILRTFNILGRMAGR
ncbi:MAG: exopolysaccharide biosynthesis polyprenyl glycosylphosphotransferase [Candidatus Magasanikbacteria bacterium]|nr:exopolysaccharide biosynthesis polyprenyl glycosylphosphotransferase [Candidatus Magasanikbacteria bacterium]